MTHKLDLLQVLLRRQHHFHASPKPSCSTRTRAHRHTRARTNTYAHTHTATHIHSHIAHAHANAHMQISKISFLMTFIDFCCCFVCFHFFLVCCTHIPRIETLQKIFLSISGQICVAASLDQKISFRNWLTFAFADDPETNYR